MIYVTHDQVEAMTMGTRIVVMKDGFIQQVEHLSRSLTIPTTCSSPAYRKPSHELHPCRILSRDGRLLMDDDAFQLPIPEKSAHYQKLVGSEAIFGIRPNDIYNRLHAPDRIKGTFVQATVDVIEPLGSELISTSQRENTTSWL